MFLNNISPMEGSRPSSKRLGRGIGSGLGKTSGKGHKGQKARSGGYHKVGFEGGQMPLQRRLPKRGFRSLSKGLIASLSTGQLNKLDSKGEMVDIALLKETGLVPVSALGVKIYLNGDITSAFRLKGIAVSEGAKNAIESVGGSLEE